MTIFEDDHDRHQFMRFLVETEREYGVLLLAACLMGNHFHLVVVTPEGNISDFMEQLEGRFAQYSNWRHGNVGHLFQGRFRAVVVENDVHLLTAACYVFLNPVVAGFARRPEEWAWSTYAATIGLRSAPEYLSIAWLEELCPADSLQASQRQFKALIDSARPVRSYLLQCERAADEHSITQVIRSYTGRHLYQGKVPPLYREALRPSLAELFPDGLRGPDREDAIGRAHLNFGYGFAEIASVLRMHAHSVRRIFRKRQQQRV